MTSVTGHRPYPDVRVGLVASAIGLLVSLGLAAYAWGRTPARIAVHFALDGRPDGWGGRAEGLLGIPALILGLTVLLVVLFAVDPRRGNLARSAPAVNAFWAAIMVMLVAVDVHLVGTALGRPLGGPDVPLLGLAVAFLVLGNYLPKLRSSLFVGVRTPWTLRSEPVWVLTHRMSGRLFLVAGVVVGVVALFGRPTTIAVIWLPLVVVLVVVPTAYSWWAWRSDPGRRAS